LSRFRKLIEQAQPDLVGQDLSRPFEELGVDSFDLMNLRVGLERELGEEISDTQWTEFRSLAQIVSYCESRDGGGPTLDGINQDTEDGYVRRFELNMPQMAIESLSESWLFKEIGASHWELLCAGLGQRSAALADEMGNRLYATFARVRHDATQPLSSFEEAEDVRLSGEISRFGGGMYISRFELESLAAQNKRIVSQMITSFSRRGGEGNTNLVKSQPQVAENSITDLAQPPQFVEEYRRIKKGTQDTLGLGGMTLQLTDAIETEFEYELNPYHDLNGVGLLYFAAYPIIADTCEAQHFNAHAASGDTRWELRWSTLARDIMYYANCDITDTIVYRLHSHRIEGGRLATTASLSRKSDGALMAKVFVVKAERL